MLSEFLLLFKVVHIVGFVAWFSGLFYLLRILVYHIDAYKYEEEKKKILTHQFTIMEKRVYSIICNPGMMLTWLCGLLMIVAYGYDWFVVNTWLHIKLILVTILTIFHLYTKTLMKKVQAAEYSSTSKSMRLMNEVPALFLIFIVALAVYKNTLNLWYTFLVIFVIGMLIFFIVKMRKLK